MRAELVRLDPKTGKRLAAFTIGRTGPDFAAASSSGSFVWAAAGDHVLRVDATGPGRVERATLRGEAAAITVGDESAWVATIGPQRDTIVRLDASTLAAQALIQVTVQPVALEAGLGSVWLATSAGLWKINAANNQVIPAPVPVASPVSLARTGNRLWVIQQDRLVTGVDRTGHTRSRIALPFAPGAVAATPSRIWVTDNCGCRTGKLAVLNIQTRRLVATRPIGETPLAVASARSGVWVATFGDSTVEHVRPSN